ncbi:MAG: tetratricopeptide repeat protein [Pyrinomonadaceae bacterium]
MATQPTDAIEVFYSYSHKDEELRDQLQEHLAMLKREGVIKGWHDRRISGGRDWEGQIDEHLNSADIILLLVSSSFIASDYCYDIEVTRAMERHEAKEARVIPIILRACDWHSAPFGKLQAFPKDVNPVIEWQYRDQAFLDIARGIRHVAEEINVQKRKVEEETQKETPKPNPHLLIPHILRVEFVERKDDGGRDLIKLLQAELTPQRPRLVALWGAGGVGKTAIAIETAHGLIETFKERVVWVSADGLKDFSLTTLLDGIAAQLGNTDLRKLTLDLKREQVRDLVVAAPTLVVLDNFETIEPDEAPHCVAWLTQPAPCAALITTRDVIDEARNISVKKMRPEEAENLLDQLIAQAHESRAFANLDRARLIETADANPLVLQWIVGQIDLAQDPAEVLDELRHGEGTAAERVFNRSFELKQLNNGGRAVLLALSLFAPSGTRKAVAEVSGLGKENDRKKFKEAIKHLSALWLIRPIGENQQLAVEGLTRELTRARLDTDPRAKTLRQRFVSRFLRYAEAHAQPNLEDYNALELEKDNLLSAMDSAFYSRDWMSVMRLMSAINGDGVSGMLTVRGYWDETIHRDQQALKAARALPSDRLIAVFTHNLAIMHQNRGNLPEARRLYNESLEIHRKLGDQRGIASNLGQLGNLAQGQGELSEARRLYDESLEIAKKLGNQSGIAIYLHNLAIIAQGQGELAEARRLYDESLEIKRKLGNQSGIASTLHQLGNLAQGQGELSEARRLYDESLEIAKKLGDQSGIAIYLHNLAIIAQGQGELAEARRLYDESLEIKRKLGDQRGIASNLGQLGSLAQDQGELSEARRLYDESLEIAKKLGDQRGIASTLLALGSLAQEQEDFSKARELYDEVLNIQKKLGSQRGIAFVLHQLGTLHFAEADYETAERLLQESLVILRQLEDKQNCAECLESIGKLRVEQGQLPAAEASFVEALGIAEVVGIPFRIGSVKRSLGLLAEKQDDKARAAQLLREAVSIFEKLGSYKLKEAQQDLARVEGDS